MRLWEAGFPAARPPTACARRPTLEFWRREPAPGKEPPAWRWSTFRFRKALRSPRGAATRGRADHRRARDNAEPRSEEHTSELQSLMRISYAVFCLKKKKKKE